MKEPPPAAWRARLEIDLRAVRANYRLLVSLAAPASVAAVVKANAYGLGMAPVARALWAEGARTFFVARLAEGLELRRILEDARIFVLDGLAAETVDPVWEEAGLIPVLNRSEELSIWADRARRRERHPEVAIHVDTGMTRLGMSPSRFAGRNGALPTGVTPCLIMSHLACADEPEHPLNARQLERFRAVCGMFPGIPRSLAASSGIFLGPAYRFELCRPGVALYGVNPTPGRPNPMQPVVRLCAPVLQVHEITERATVGYGATYEVRAGDRIATVAAGYADGLLRSAGKRGTARIDGKEIPLAGRISMDLLSVDISALPSGSVVPGTMVELIGGPDGVDRFAAAAGTIGYEVLTRLGSRLERRYLGEEETS